MAFGKPPDVRRIKNAVLEDTLLRNAIIQEERSRKTWKSRWNWLLEEHAELQEKLAGISKQSVLLREVQKDRREKDERTIKPVPETTNHEYGWIPNLPDFVLEKYGPDYDRGAPLPEIYHIFKS